ncbi:MAG: DUF1616 domain-containing protein [Dehalobacter sp.]|nr:DUF1616 domain-containing protein [Dehalobacter sp.]
MAAKNANIDRIESPEVDIRRYFRDMALDLKLTWAFVLVMLVFIYFPYLNETPVRSALGLVMILFIPGYALIAALFPGKRDLGRMERASLSLGLSIAVSSLIGLGLNFTPFGIRLDPLAICLSLFTVIGVAIANKRRHDLPEDERLSVSLKSVRTAIGEEILPASARRLDRALNLILIAVVLLSVGLTVFVLAVPKQGEKFTEFYVLGPTGMTENYPLEFYLNDTKPITLGIVNHEYANVTYDVEVKLGDGTNSEILYPRSVVRLAAEQRWEQSINLTPSLTGTGLRLDFLLYRDGNINETYRDLHLWVNVTKLI